MASHLAAAPLESKAEVGADAGDKYGIFASTTLARRFFFPPQHRHTDYRSLITFPKLHTRVTKQGRRD